MTRPPSPAPSSDARSPTAPGVRVHGGRLAFGGVVLFDDLSVSLAGARWTCLLGPSGIGKTSLIKMIAGLVPIPPTTRIVCDDGAPLAGRVAYMAQQDLLMPWLSLIDNVTIGARLRTGRRAAPDLASRARTARSRRARRARRRSAGAVLGRHAAMHGAGAHASGRPAGDADGRAVLGARRHHPGPAAEPRRRVLVGRTVLLVTHDPLEALRLGHDVHVMSGRPARLDEALAPDGAPPRDPTDRTILARQGELLSRLLAASAT